MSAEGSPPGERASAEFGCGHCWPADAAAAWQARRGFRPAAVCVDESHYRVTLLHCPSCAQAFVSVFTERIDWADGDDPQRWIVLPLTAAEATALAASETGEEMLATLAPDRRSLCHDAPKGRAPTTAWTHGLWVDPHD